MKIAIIQPYFFPYLGYFQLANSVDKFVFYDDVNFIRKGWINRNRILLNGKEFIFTLALKSASQNKLINQIDICEGNDRILKTIKYAYLRAPFFDDTYQLIDQVFESMNEIKCIAKLAEISVKKVAEYLGIRTIFETSSETYGSTEGLRREERLITICQINNADVYINPSGGINLYSKENFRKKGIHLFFMKNSLSKYKQFSDHFVSGLSIIDIMMFNDKKTIKEFLNAYVLV